VVSHPNGVYCAARLFTKRLMPCCAVRENTSPADHERAPSSGLPAGSLRSVRHVAPMAFTMRPLLLSSFCGKRVRLLM
jgi:hypothetical protein